jgi:hypothetical protein
MIDERFRERDAQNTEDFYEHRKLVLKAIRAALEAERKSKRKS